VYGKYVPYYISSNDTVASKIHSYTGLTLFFYGLQYHYNFNYIGKEQSLSFHTFPTLGYNYDYAVERSQGIGIQLPIFLNFNSGAGANPKSRSEYGYTLGIGAEYISSIMFTDKYSTDLKASLNATKPIIQPALNIGYRFVNAKEKLTEVNLKAGFTPKKVKDIYGKTFASEVTTSSWWVRLALTYYIGEL
jgi:hypothetical protein